MACDQIMCLIILAMFNVVDTNGLLVHGNSNSSDQTNGHFVDISEIMQKLENLTQQVESFKQQAEIDKSTLKLLLNQSQELENFRQQAVNDRSTIQSLQLLLQSLQNRVFFLEAELTKLNATKPPSTQELSTYLMSMNKLIQNMAANEENDKNVTQRLNVLAKHFDDLNLQVRYTSLSLLDVHSMTETLNGSLVHLLEERLSAFHDHIANVSTRIGFTASVSSHNSSWRSGTLVFPSVITNVGNGYDPSDGVFTAPVVGVYVFFVNVQSYESQSIYVDVVLNGGTKVRTMGFNGGGSEYEEAGPNMVVLSLQTGDRVWVKHHSGQGYWSDGPITTFSGFLI